MFDPSRIYSVPQIHRESGAPSRMIYETLERGELQAIRRGRRWLVPGGAVNEWIAALATASRDE